LQDKAVTSRGYQSPISLLSNTQVSNIIPQCLSNFESSDI